MKAMTLLTALLVAALTAACGGEQPTNQPAEAEGPLPTLRHNTTAQNTPVAEAETTPADGTARPVLDQAEPTEQPFRLFSREEMALLQAESDRQEPATKTRATPSAGPTPEARQHVEEGKLAGNTPDTASQESGSPAEKIPAEPQFTETPTLQEIYAGMDLSIYGLNPNQPLEEYGGIEEQRPFEEYRDHPYLHLFPSLQTTIEAIAAQAVKAGQSHPKTFYHHLYEEEKADKVTATPLRTYGIEQFLAHPWFDPMTGYELGHLEVTRISPGYGRGHVIQDISPPYFGRDSLRETIAQTVGQLLEDAVIKDAEPLMLRWGEIPSHGPHGPLSRLENPATLSEYIRRPFIPENGSRTLDQGFRATGSYTTPKVRWDFMSPSLPIVKVATTVTDRLPLRGPETRVSTDSDGTEIKIDATRYTVAFVVAFQNRWSIFEDPNRWAIRFKDSLRPIETKRDFQEGDMGRIAELRDCPSNCIFTKEVGALDPNMEDHWPNYWHASDYMHHSIIGPVVVTVHESKVLQPGTYTALPRINTWDAPGPILTADKLMTPNPGDKVERNFIQMYPYPQSPNPGFPLPGHLLADAFTRPGSEIWNEYDLGPDWN